MAFTPYANTGAFINNTTPPGISSTFLNNIENFLDQIVSSATADSSITSDGSGNLATTGTMQTANGKAFRSKDTGGTVRNLLLIDGSNQVKLGAANTNNIILVDKSGNPLFTVSGNGAALNAGTLSLIAGSISRIAFGFSSVSSGGTTITHNLGAVPEVVLIQCAGGTVGMSVA